MTCQEEVRALRQEMGLNRREFCAYFDIPYRTVADWEAGKRSAPAYVVRLLQYKVRVEKMLKEKQLSLGE